MTIAHLAQTTMDVYSVAEDQSDAGGLIENETLKFSDVPCTIEIARGSEGEVIGRRGVIITHWIFCDVLAIVEKDIIKSGGRVYDISLADDVQGRGHHMEIEAIVRE